jgi:hypothetical protein
MELNELIEKLEHINAAFESVKTSQVGRWQLPVLQTKLCNALPDILLALRQASDGWMPIESAPKDGTRVLLTWHWDAGSGNKGVSVVLASWDCRTHKFLSLRHKCPNEPDCKMAWDNYAGEMTHWQSLPEPPVARAATKEGDEG